SVDLFKKVMYDNAIKIVAITNHNAFIMERYIELSNAVKETTMVWPGIELTVDAGNGERHLIIISSPNYVEEFKDNLQKIIGDTKPDKVCIPIEKLKGLFNPNKVIYIAHYHDKEKKFFDDEVELLKGMLTSEDLLFLEPTNITSMGIFLDHDMRSIIGSDVVDWNNYPKHKIPSLRLKVDDFEMFRQYAKKDKVVVEKILSRESNFDLHLEGFWNKNLKFFKDFNIIFGGKGTGKSVLAKEIYEKLKIEHDQVKYYNSESSSV